MNSLTIPSHQFMQSVSGRQKLLLSLLAVFLLLLAVILALGRESHSLLGVSAGAAVPGTTNSINANIQSSASEPASGSAGAVSSEGDSVSTNSSSVNVQVNASSTTASDGSTNSGANMMVNGQAVPINNPNSIHKSVHSSGSNTNVNIQIQNNGGAGDSM